MIARARQFARAHGLLRWDFLALNAYMATITAAAIGAHWWLPAVTS